MNMGIVFALNPRVVEGVYDNPIGIREPVWTAMSSLTGVWCMKSAAHDAIGFVCMGFICIGLVCWGSEAWIADMSYAASGENWGRAWPPAKNLAASAS